MKKRKFGRDRLRDNRDYDYLIMAPTSRRPWRYWNDNGWWGDQGFTSQCVGYAFAHYLEDGPITHRDVAPVATPRKIYTLAKTLDEWEGTSYEGTSVRGGAKALQAMGWISEYRWTWDLMTLVDTILDVGPVVVGTAWKSGMDNWSRSGVLDVSGRTLGGHAYIVNGVNVSKGLFRMKNSWGRSWCKRGHAYITFDGMRKLIEEDGEVCLAIENKFPDDSQ